MLAIVEPLEVEASGMEEDSSRASLGWKHIPFDSADVAGTPYLSELEVALFCTGGEESRCLIWLAQFSSLSPASVPP